MKKRVFAFVFIVVTLLGYMAGLQSNPPAYHADESSIAYNALCIARTGADEWGIRFPFYFRAFGEYKNPVYIYMLAGAYRLVPPSNLVARRLSALLGYLAALAIGWIAFRITRTEWIGWSAFVAALITPQLFEISRLVFEVALFPLAVALFLWAAHIASQRERWSAKLVVALVSSLVLVTLSYSVGRLLALLFALALFIVANTRERRIGAAIVFGLYLVFGVLPLVIYNYRLDGALTYRLKTISTIYQYEGHPVHQLDALEQQYVLNTLPLAMALKGDLNPRHHVRGALGSILLGTFLLVAASIVIILRTRRHERWWIFMIAVTLLTIVPASLTEGRNHTLRLAAYPVALIILTIPALEALAQKNAMRVVAMIAIAMCVAQASWFFYAFAKNGPQRFPEFDVGFRPLLRQMLARPERPIYIAPDVYYVHAYWYGALMGVDRSTFKPVPSGADVPPGALAIGIPQDDCSDCKIVAKEAGFTAWTR